MTKTVFTKLKTLCRENYLNKFINKAYYLLIFICLIYSKQTKSQVSTGYIWSQSFQTYKPASSTTSTTPADIFITGWDDEIYTTYKFPFNFTYNGTLYTAGVGTIGVDSDGWIAFNTGAITMTGTTFGGSWVSATDHTGVYLNGTANNNGFAGFNSDVEEQVFATFTGNRTNGSATITAVSDFTNIRVGVRLSGTGITDGTIVSAFNAAAQTITMSSNATATNSTAVTPSSSVYAFLRGIAPYRQYVIQWTRASRYSAVTGDDFSFQLVLNEGGGVATYQTLQAVYGTLTTINAGSQNAQVGLRGNTAADFNARTTAANWSATTAAAVNTATCNLTSAVFPVSGLTYTWSPPCAVAASAAGAISGTNPVCPGTSVDYSIAGVPGAIFYNWTYTGGGTTLSGTTTLPLNTLNFGAGATGGTLTVTPGNLCGNGASSSLVIAVTSVTSATISYPLATYCQSVVSPVSPTLTGPAGGTYTSSPSGLTMTSAGVITPSTSTAGSYTVTYSYTSGSCSLTTTTTVAISPDPVVTVTATPSTVCSGGNSQLSAAVNAGGNYTVTSIAYSNLTPTAGSTELWGATYGDENISAAITLPFTFTYYGQNITQFYAYVNGYISLGATSANSATPQAVPNPATPNNVIALAWDDLECDNIFFPGAYVRYFVNGTAPNRIMVIEYNKLDFFWAFDGEVTGQIRLYESDNHIEVAVTTVNDVGLLDVKTLGIENSLGTVGITPAGRNNAAWNVTNEAWSFTPKPVSYLWTPATFLSSTVINNPVATGVTATTPYNVRVTDIATGCFQDGTVTVTLGSPLSGVYTVGVGGNYTTLTAAVAAYNSLCLGGPVTFSLIDNTYPSETFPISINQNSYASATNTLTIKPAATKTPLISGSSATSLIQFKGCDYVTIDGSNTVAGTTRNLRITNTAATSNAVLWLTSSSASDGATNNSIRNCEIFGASQSGTIACILTGSYLTAGADAEFPNNNNTIQNDSMYLAQNGIYIRGKTASLDQNWLVTKNVIGSTTVANKMGFRGIGIINAQNFNITSNTIAGVTLSTALFNAYGIGVYLNINTGMISENSISDVRHTSVYGAHGIYLGASTTASNLTVQNNFIYDIAAAGFNGFTSADNGYGLTIDAGGGYKVYFNTIVFNTSSNATAAGNKTAAGLVTSGVTTPNAIDMRNNIFMNNQSAGNANSRMAFISTAANTVYSNTNYNDYFASNSNLLSKGAGLFYTTLAALQGALGGNLNSVSVNPLFVSTTDLHLQSVPANSVMTNLGTPIAGITTDYDVTTRNGLTPDMGADEWLMPNTGSWVGKTSIDWLTNTNWETNKVPDRSIDVTITGGYTFLPTIVTTQAVRGLAMSTPGTPPVLTLSGGTLQVYGTMTRSGSGGGIDGSNGTLEMDSSIASQPIPANMFVSNNLKNLIVNNSNNPGVSINGALDIYRSVTYGASGSNLTTNSNLTFKSTATETAWLGNMTGKILTGTVTIERYIPTGINHNKTWQLLAAPIKSAVSLKVSWMENNASLANAKPGYGTTISSEVLNAVSRGYDFYTPISGSAGGPSLKTYNPATNAWVGFDDGVTATGSKALTPQKKGYFLFVRGDRSVVTSGGAAVPTVLRITGTPYTNGVNIPPVTTVLAGKLETIGNPYPSAIDFTLVTRQPGVDNVFYLWDPKLYGTNGLGGYQTISSVVGYLPTPGSTNYPAGTPVTKIQSGQAFFVHGTAGGTVTFTEGSKATGSSLVVKAAPLNLHWLSLNLYKLSTVDLGPVDGNVVALDKDYSNAYEKKDALKISNTSENIGIASNGQVLAVEARKPFTKNDTVFYNISNLRIDAYQFRFGPRNLSYPNLEAYLVDQFLNTTTPVSLTDSTIIDINITSDPGSYQAGRFYLIFKRQRPTPHLDARTAAIPASETGNEKASVTVHPNPLVNKVLTVSFSKQVPGTYRIELSNKLGQVILNKTILISNNNVTESIQLGREVAAGNYQLTIIAENGKKTTQQVIVQ